MPSSDDEQVEKTGRLAAAFEEALNQPDIDRGVLEQYLGRAMVEGLGLVKDRKASRALLRAVLTK